MDDWVFHRMTDIARRVEADGYQIIPIAEPGVLLHKRNVQLSRFGLVDSVVSLRPVEGGVSRPQVVQHENDTVAAALSTKTKLPRGLGSAVEIFAVTLAAEATAEAVAAAQSPPRNQWCIMSTQALVHGPDQRLAMFEGRKIWGGAYVNGLRKRVQGWLS